MPYAAALRALPPVLLPAARLPTLGMILTNPNDVPSHIRSRFVTAGNVNVTRGTKLGKKSERCNGKSRLPFHTAAKGEKRQGKQYRARQPQERLEETAPGREAHLGVGE